jgi:hypothetical protein
MFRMTWTRRGCRLARQIGARRDGVGRVGDYRAEASIRNDGAGLWTAVAVYRRGRTVSTAATRCETLHDAQRWAIGMAREIITRSKQQEEATR